MAKVYMPLLGGRASGSIAKSVTFTSWRGINIARQRVDPANPRTVAQTSQRDLFTYCVTLWSRLPVEIQDAWYPSVKGAAMTAANLFTKINTDTLRGDQYNTDIVWSPGQSGAAAITNLSATAGSGSVTVSATVGGVPQGYVIERVRFVLTKRTPPAGRFQGVVLTQHSESSPYSVTFTGLESGAYVVGAFTECKDNTLKKVYGVSLSTVVSLS